jgi:hypothetical protein
LRCGDLGQPAAIDLGHQLALVEIAQHLGLALARDRQRAAAAGAAAVEAEHQPRPLLGAAMHPGIDAQGPVIAVQPRVHDRIVLEARPPHQRAIGEDPDFGGVGRGWGHAGQTLKLKATEIRIWSP